MATVSNSPAQQTTLRLQARKSLALGIKLVDRHGRPFDISASQLRLVIRKTRAVVIDDTDVLVNSTALIVDAEEGVARFSLQAADLDHKPGTYEYSITLSDGGYSSTIVSGEVELEQNTEFTSVTETYDEELVASTLQVTLKGQKAIQVSTGSILGPGEVPFVVSDKDGLDGLLGLGLSRGDLVPTPYAPLELLTAQGAGKGNFGWAQAPDPQHVLIFEDPEDPGYFIAQGHGSVLIEDEGDPGFFKTFDSKTLPSDGVAQGAVPTANGADGWSWQPPPLPGGHSRRHRRQCG